MVSTFARKKVLVIDDHALMRQGIVRLINDERDFMVCGQAEGITDGMSLVESLNPDLVVLDMILRDGDGLALAKELRSRFPKMGILLISAEEENVYANRAVEAGADGYVMKDVVFETMIQAMRTIRDGKIHLGQNVAEPDLFSPRTVRGGGLDGLSNRELQIFSDLGSGFRPSEIAKKLRISIKTVETYRTRIKSKLKLRSCADLLRYAIRHRSG